MTVVTTLVGLTRAFLAGELTASDFDTRYRQAFSELPLGVDGARFDVLEELAIACNDFVEDPDLRDEPGDLGEVELLDAAHRMLQRLGTVSPQDLSGG